MDVEGGGGGDCERTKLIVGVTFEATRQYSSKLSSENDVSELIVKLQKTITLSDALPHPILVSFAQTRHSFSVPPPDKISFLQLTHK